MGIYGGNNIKVSTLTENNEWKNYLNYIPIHYHNTVHNIKIDNQLRHDYWFWLPSNDGQFNLNSAWDRIRSKHTKVKWSKVIWDNKYAPKMSTCSLLAILNKLNTKDRISWWNNDINQICASALIKMKIETIFFSIAHIPGKFYKKLCISFELALETLMISINYWNICVKFIAVIIYITIS